MKDQVANTGHALKRMEESTRGPGHVWEYSMFAYNLFFTDLLCNQRTERLRLERLKSEYSDVAKRYRNVLRVMSLEHHLGQFLLLMYVECDGG